MARRLGLPVWVTADALAPSLMIGGAIGRVGCFFNGCCYGRPTRLPWGVSFPADSFAGLDFGNALIHPSQLYFALAGLTLFGLVWGLRGRSGVPDNSLASTSAVYTYTARLCAADGTSCASATTGTVTVPAGVAPPPSASSCGNLPIITPVTDDLNAIPSDLTFNNQRFVAKNFTGTNVVVGTIKVPVNAAGKRAVNVYEHASPNPIQRRIWLSKTRCDMTATSGPSTTSMSTSLSNQGRRISARGSRIHATRGNLVRNDQERDPGLCAGRRCGRPDR